MLLFLPCLLLLSLTASAEDTDTENYRLPKNILPSHYILELVINPEDNTYSGLVEITITAKDIVNDTIKLHASPNYLKVKSYALLDYTTSCDVSETDNITEIITLECPKGSLEGEHKIALEFSANIVTGNKNGVYQSKYTENGKEEVLIATDFHPAYARRAFPCFDEPTFKATFDLFITRPDAYKVLANTPEDDQFYVGVGQLQSKFTTTPKMSTYVVAFVVSKFDATVNVTNGNYSYSIYTRSSVKDNLGVASTYGQVLVDKLSEWTAISYEKLGDKQIDQVALPDVTTSDIENWGLITYREADLLDDGKKTAQEVKQRIITTIAHELTEQWFADYVTPDWWSDAWLSEGFATYFQYYIPDLIEGEKLELENQFVVNVLQNVLLTDGPTSSPLSSNETDVNSISDDVKKLDEITFSKGASVIRMIKGMTGNNKFQSGVRSYLKKHRYNYTDVEEFLDEIQYGRFASDFAIKTWLYQPGYPLLKAEYSQNWSYVTISQEPFHEENNLTDGWYIPISYTTSEERDFSIEMKDILVPGYRNRIEKISNTTWLVLNLQHHGYYRVNYDDWLWDKLIEALKNEDDRKDIHALNRAQLIDDIFAIARTGRVEYQKAFDLASYLSLETDYYPWATALNVLTSLGNKLQSNDTEDLLKKTVQSWWTDAMAKRKNESSTTNPLKEAFFLDRSCKFGLDDCLNYVTKAFSDFKNSKSLADYNNRATIFCYGLRNSSSPIDDYNFLLDLYTTSTSSDERSDIITGMGCSLDDDVLSTYLKETMADNSRIRKEDVAAVYRSVYTSGGVGLKAVLEFAFENAPDIEVKYEGLGVVTSIVTGVAPMGQAQNYINKIIDYYSDMSDIMASEKTVIFWENEIRRFNDKYAQVVQDILTEKTNNACSLRANYMFMAILPVITFYFVRY